MAQAALTAFAAEWDLEVVGKGYSPARGPLARFQRSINQAGWISSLAQAALTAFASGRDLEVVGNGNLPNY